MPSTHISGRTLGDHFVLGWWVKHGMQPLAPRVVIEVAEGYQSCIEKAVTWCLSNGAKTVQVLCERVLPEPQSGR